MGCCGSDSLTPEARAALKREKLRDKEISRQNHETQLYDSQIKKLLLLGAGESGKSTLFKQMITLYGQGYSLEDRKGFTNIVYNNTISAMKTLVKYSDEFEEELGTRVTAQNQARKQFMQELKPDRDIDLEVADIIAGLWADPGIQATYEHRSKFQLPDSASYFFDRVHEIGRAEYIPTEQDVLRSRVRTTGIVETSFDIEGNKFKMFDVGGQRNERKKWIHCFENVTSVIFVAAVSEYDQMLYEDETTNRMMEALSLFDEICNSRWFRDTSIILFLNKKDLFEQKITKVPLTVCFTHYTGPNTFEAASEFLKNEFENKNRSKEKEIYTHITCATDTRNVAHVFNAVKDIIIRKSLRETGLLM